MDCAAKFEKNVARLPGVTRAEINAMAGKITVEGEVSLEEIRREGAAENYTISPPGDGEQGESPVGGKVHLARIIAAGTLIPIAYFLRQSGFPSILCYPLYITAILLGGWGNFQRAVKSLPRWDFNMSVLMTLAVIGAVAIGEWTEAMVVSFLYGLSEYLEYKTMDRARRSLGQLLDLAPQVARRVTDDGEEEVSVYDLSIGDIIRIRPGEKIPMDGEVDGGHSTVDEAPITGESMPVEKEPGDEVYAGSFNQQGSITIHVTHRAEDNTLAKIIHYVEEAQTRKAPSQALVDKFAQIYTPIVLALAVVLSVLPPLLWGYEWIPWIYRGLALLVVSCPCALVVSTPVAIVSAIGHGAKNGVLFKGGMYLEELGAVQAMAFDKTGTLTRGEPTLQDVHPVEGVSEEELIQLAVTLEGPSEHPLSRAVVEGGRHRGISPDEVENFQAVTGRGVEGVIDGRLCRAGNRRLFEDEKIDLSPVENLLSTLEEKGETPVIVASESKVLGVLALADDVRAESRAVLAALKKAGIQETLMITGDQKRVAAKIAAEVNIDRFEAELLPEDKVRHIESLGETWGKVAMLGDGINDAPALAAAHVGIAMGGAGSDAAVEAADVALMGDDLKKLPYALRLSRKTLAVIRQNIAFSLIVKFLALAAVFPGWLTLWLAIAADMGATIAVTLNGIRLVHFQDEEGDMETGDVTT